MGNQNFKGYGYLPNVAITNTAGTVVVPTGSNVLTMSGLSVARGSTLELQTVYAVKVTGSATVNGSLWFDGSSTPKPMLVVMGNLALDAGSSTLKATNYTAPGGDDVITINGAINGLFANAAGQIASPPDITYPSGSPKKVRFTLG